MNRLFSRLSAVIVLASSMSAVDAFAQSGVQVTNVTMNLTAPGANNHFWTKLKAEISILGTYSNVQYTDMTGSMNSHWKMDFDPSTRDATITGFDFAEDPSGPISLSNMHYVLDLPWPVSDENILTTGLRATPATPGYAPPTYAPVNADGTFDLSNHSFIVNQGSISWSGFTSEGSPRNCGAEPINTQPTGTGTVSVVRTADIDWTHSTYAVSVLAPVTITDYPVDSGTGYNIWWSISGTLESHGTFNQTFTPTAAYWDTSATAGLQAGNGTWSTSAASWSPTAGGGNPLLSWYSNGSTLDVYFNTSGASTVTLGQNISAKSLTFNGTGYEIAGSGSYTFTLTGGTITANQSAIISAPLAGSNGLKKYGAADLTLSGGTSNTYGGTTTVYAGTLLLAKTGSARAIANSGLTIGDNTNPAIVRYAGTSTDMMGTGTVVINRNGTLDFNGKTDAIGGVILYGNSTSIGQISNTAGGGALTVNSLGFAGGGTAATGSGKIVLGGDVIYTTATGGVAAGISGNVDLNAIRTFTIADDAGLASEMDVSAAIANGSGAGGLNKDGPGTLTLSGNASNTYSGSTSVSAGTLLLAKTGSAQAIGNSGLTIGRTSPATVRYTGSSTDMMGTGGVSITDLGTLDFNGKTDGIGGVTIYGNSSGAGQISNTAGGGALTVGTLGFSGGGNVATGTGKIVLGGNVTYTTAYNGVAPVISGNLDLNSLRTFTIGDDAGLASEMDVSAVIANGNGVNGLVKDGPGTLTLSGNASNTYSGMTSLNAGTFLLAKTGGANAIANGGLTIGGNSLATVRYTGSSTDMMGSGTVTITHLGVLDFNGKTDTIGNAAISGYTGSSGQIVNTAGGGTLTLGTLGFSGGGAVATGTGKIVLGGTVTYSTIVSGVAATISGNVDLNATRNFAIADDAALSSEMIVSAVIANGSGTNGFVKDGLGKMTLTSDNTFSGNVMVSGGTLALAGNGQIHTPINNNGIFEISDGTANHAVGAITGSGTTQLYSDARLSAPSITQGTLTIGGARGRPESQPVPEPSALLLLATAGLGILRAAWARK
jgi:fibronectin-binding autotransporter adhesin